jgi:hypothetical protein
LPLCPGVPAPAALGVSCGFDVEDVLADPLLVERFCAPELLPMISTRCPARSSRSFVPDSEYLRPAFARLVVVPLVPVADGRPVELDPVATAGSTETRTKSVAVGAPPGCASMHPTMVISCCCPVVALGRGGDCDCDCGCWLPPAGGCC